MPATPIGGKPAAESITSSTTATLASTAGESRRGRHNSIASVSPPAGHATMPPSAPTPSASPPAAISA